MTRKFLFTVISIQNKVVTLQRESDGELIKVRQGERFGLVFDEVVINK